MGWAGGLPAICHIDGIEGVRTVNTGSFRVRIHGVKLARPIPQYLD
jgi:hypothetical protein